MKHKSNLIKHSFCVVICLLANVTYAQKFAAEAKISEIEKTGIYEIKVPAHLRSLSKDDLSDFRIFDSKGEEVPYFLNQKVNETSLESFKEIAIIERRAIPNKNSFIIIANTSGRTLNSLVLDISNTDLVKTYSISGSNDRQQWFGLVNDEQLNDLVSANNTSVLKTINFPVNSYKYIKIDFNDRETLPLNILKLGTISSTITNASLEEIAPKSYTVKNFPSEKLTRIYFKFREQQIINQIAFTIDKPTYYKRNATLLVLRSRKVKHKVENYQEVGNSFELSSASRNVFNLSELREKQFVIEIENQDNPALSFADIKLYQLPISVVTNLEVNQLYTINTGSDEVAAPQYDLSYFKSNVLNHLTSASIYDVKDLHMAKVTEGAKPIWQQAWAMMWFGIAVVGGIIVYFSVSIIKDLNSKG